MSIDFSKACNHYKGQDLVTFTSIRTYEYIYIYIECFLRKPKLDKLSPLLSPETWIDALAWDDWHPLSCVLQERSPQHRIETTPPCLWHTMIVTSIAGWDAGGSMAWPPSTPSVVLHSRPEQSAKLIHMADRQFRAASLASLASFP